MDALWSCYPVAPFLSDATIRTNMLSILLVKTSPFLSILLVDTRWSYLEVNEKWSLNKRIHDGPKY